MKIFLLFIMLTSSCLAISKQEDKNPFSLKLDQETFLTNEKGIFNPQAILTLKPGSSVRIYLLNGQVLNGLIKTTELVNNSIFKVFGDITNQENTGFGFVLTGDGVFGGAVVFRNKKITYKIQYLENEKCYILIEDKTDKITS